MKLHALALLLAACSPAICAPDELTRALGEASPGDVVVVGECEIAGAFTVPAGVTLRGEGEASVLSSVDSGAVIDVGGDGVLIERLSVHADDGYYGIRAVGAQDLTISETTVVVTRGIGMGLRDGTYTLVSVSLEGPIDASNAETAPVDPEMTGTIGLALEESVSSLEGVRARGFAVVAIAILGGELTWTDLDDTVDVEATLGIGVALQDAAATLDGVELGSMLSGVLRPGFALTCRGGTLDLHGARIREGLGSGIFAHACDATLADVTIENLGLVGIQAQAGSLHASDVTLRANGGVGLAALDMREIWLERVVASAQTEKILPNSDVSAMFADGVHVRRTSAAAPLIDLRASDLVVEENARAGMVIDAADTAPARLELSVRASASGVSLGVVAPHTMVAPDWDTDVAREGTALANDTAFPGEIDLVGLLMPPSIPVSAP